MHIEDLNLNDSNLESSWIDELHKYFTTFYKELEETITKILNLQENWDGEGGTCYTKETLYRAAEFVKKISFVLWRKTQKLISPPNILPGPDGSINVHWKSTKFDLLVNIPENPNESATFASDDYEKNAVKGTFDQKKINPALFYWLIEFL